MFVEKRGRIAYPREWGLPTRVVDAIEVVFCAHLGHRAHTLAAAFFFANGKVLIADAGGTYGFEGVAFPPDHKYKIYDEDLAFRQLTVEELRGNKSPYQYLEQCPVAHGGDTV